MTKNEVYQLQATISVLVRELDSVRLIAIEAAAQANALKARVEELEKATTQEEQPPDGSAAGS